MAADEDETDTPLSCLELVRRMEAGLDVFALDYAELYERALPFLSARPTAARRPPSASVLPCRRAQHLLAARLSPSLSAVPPSRLKPRPPRARSRSSARPRPPPQDLLPVRRRKRPPFLAPAASPRVATPPSARGSARRYAVDRPLSRAQLVERCRRVYEGEPSQFWDPSKEVDDLMNSAHATTPRTPALDRARTRSILFGRPAAAGHGPVPADAARLREARARWRHSVPRCGGGSG